MELQPGDLIHYSNLRLICPDRDLRGRHRWILTAARRIALRDGEMVFGVVKGVGLKRLTNEEVAAIPSSAIASTRRLVARSLRKSACCDYARLAPQEQRAFNAGCSVLGTVKQFTKPQTIKRIQDSAERRKLSFDETLRLFR